MSNYNRPIIEVYAVESSYGLISIQEVHESEFYIEFDTFNDGRHPYSPCGIGLYSSLEAARAALRKFRPTAKQIY